MIVKIFKDTNSKMFYFIFTILKRKMSQCSNIELQKIISKLETYEDFNLFGKISKTFLINFDQLGVITLERSIFCR